MPPADVKVLELVVYTLKDGTTQEQFVAAFDELSEWLRPQPGFVSRELLDASAEGKWIELVWWQDADSAHAVAAAAETAPECAPFFAAIDIDNALLLHGELAAAPVLAVNATG